MWFPGVQVTTAGIPKGTKALDRQTFDSLMASYYSRKVCIWPFFILLLPSLSFFVKEIILTALLFSMPEAIESLLLSLWSLESLE